MAEMMNTGYTGGHENSLNIHRVRTTLTEYHHTSFSACGLELTHGVKERSLMDLTHRHSMCRSCWAEGARERMKERAVAARDAERATTRERGAAPDGGSNEGHPMFDADVAQLRAAQAATELSRTYRREVITFLKERVAEGGEVVSFGALLADDLTLRDAVNAIVD